MPKKAKELSALSVAKIKENGRHAVGGVDGLHLRIVDGSRAWVLRVAVGKKVDDHGKVKTHRRDIGLGSFPEVSLSEAREKGRELKKKIRDGEITISIFPIFLTELRNSTNFFIKEEKRKWTTRKAEKALSH